MFKKIGLFFCGVVLVFLCFFAFIGVYRLINSLLNPDKLVNVFGYTDYIVIEDNLENYSKGDLAIIKLDEVYKSSDYVIYNYFDNKFFSKIENVSDQKYTMINGHVIYESDIIGLAVYKINNFETMFNILTSPFVIIVILGLTFLYFYLIINGKIKEV